MISVAIVMLIWMMMTIMALANPEFVDGIRAWALTPIVFLMTVLIWTYAISRTKRKVPFIKEISEREKIQ